MYFSFKKYNPTIVALLQGIASQYFKGNPWCHRVIPGVFDLRVTAVWSGVMAIYSTYLAWEGVGGIGGGCIRKVSYFLVTYEFII